jgi:hypothetical protein
MPEKIEQSEDMKKVLQPEEVDDRFKKMKDTPPKQSAEVDIKKEQRNDRTR